MKRMVMLVGIVCVVFIVGCGGNESPSSVARKFYTALEKNDTRAMAQVATTETVQMMAMLGEKAQGMMTAYGKIKSTTEKIDISSAFILFSGTNRGIFTKKNKTSKRKTKIPPINARCLLRLIY